MFDIALYFLFNLLHFLISSEVIWFCLTAVFVVTPFISFSIYLISVLIISLIALSCFLDLPADSRYAHPWMKSRNLDSLSNLSRLSILECYFTCQFCDIPAYPPEHIQYGIFQIAPTTELAKIIIFYQNLLYDLLIHNQNISLDWISFHH